MYIELHEVNKHLQAAYNAVLNIEPKHGATKNRLANILQQEIKRIDQLTGLNTFAQNKTTLPPLTHIMGQPIQRREPVTEQTITPTDTERDNFLRERDSLYDQFGTLSNEKIQGKLMMPMGESVIRAVAKKAGIEDYKEAEITTVFFNRIREAIKGIKKAEKELAEAAKKVHDSNQ